MRKRSYTEATMQDEGEVERSLLAYLQHHPQAADTLQGIVNWWLPRQRYESGYQRVEQVLRTLVARSTLRSIELPNGEVLYALNKRTGPPRKH